DGVVAVLLEDAQREPARDLEPHQEDERVLGAAPLAKGLLKRQRALLAETGDLAEAVGRAEDHLDRLVAEGVDQTAGELVSDARHEAGGEVAREALFGGRYDLGVAIALEAPPEAGVVLPTSLGAHGHAFDQAGHRTDQGRLALLRAHARHGPEVVRIDEADRGNHTLQHRATMARLARERQASGGRGSAPW